MNTANAPATASVQRKVVVRAKSGRGTEDETRATHILNHRRIGWLVYLPPQPPHVNVDEVGLRDELVVPHLFEQHGARQHLLFAAHHIFEQAEFAWQQVDRSLPALRGALDQVELERSYPQHRIPTFRR